MDEFEPGDALLFMKVGTHAQEELSEIIARKQAEIAAAGYTMWGYGGNTCHPSTMVQPFARTHALASKPILLVMQPMISNHFAEPVRAEEFSIDGRTWQEVPAPINVLGSRFALCITNLREEAGALRVGNTRVAIGNSKGKSGEEYIRGRVDKACLEVVAGPSGGESIDIGLVAEVVEPFAVFLH
jgi:hypothetical protein